MARLISLLRGRVASLRAIVESHSRGVGASCRAFVANSLALSYNRVVLIRIEGLSPGDAMYLDLLACDVARERAPVRIYIPEAFCEPVICIRQWLVAVKP